MPEFIDLREWISRAEKIGELAIVEGSDVKYEMGAVDEICSRNQGPAVIFQKIKGYRPEFRVMTNLLSNIRTVNLTFGLPLENTIKDSIEILTGNIVKWEGSAGKFTPKWVESGPIQDNVVTDDDIDLTIFPAPVWHELDGGPYIGTADAVITRDPDTGHINVGTYRCQLLDRRTVGMNVSLSHHGRIHRDKYFERGEACPVAVLFGLDPLLFAISCSELPHYISELDYVGAIRGESVPIIRGRTTGLPIPANAEIAIEGFAEPGLTRKEGPFGEWTGHYASGIKDSPFIKATTLYYRNDPILCGSAPSKASYSDEGFLRSIWRSARINELLIRAGIPDVKGVYSPPVGGSRYLDVIAIKQRYDGHASDAGHVASAFSGRYIVIVDDDIDPHDLDDVIWAISTRSRPSESDIIKKARSAPSDPTIPAHSPTFVTSRQIIYATKQYERLKDYPPVSIASQELREKVFYKWKEVFKERWRTI